MDPKQVKELRTDVLFAVLRLLAALFVLFFMDKPPDVRESIWLTTRWVIAVAAGLDVAYCTWRWRHWSKRT